MFRLFLKSLTNHNPNPNTNPCIFTIFRFIQTESAPIKPNDKQSRTVNYLIDSCGLSLESALSFSRSNDITNFKKSDSILELFRSYGFSPEDISSLISKHPRIIVSDPVKTLRPKLEFFESMGVARPELPRLVNSYSTNLLHRSLENYIVPTFNLLKAYVDVNKDPVSAVKILNSIATENFEKSILPKVEILRAYGVPQLVIGKLLMLKSRTFTLRLDLFREVVKVVKEKGFHPKSSRFIMAIMTIAAIPKPIWERKKETLISLGWTENDFDMAFKLRPNFMVNSEKKMRELIDFLVEKAGLTSCDVARYPYVLHVSLEKRVIPRWSVVQILTSKGMFEKSDLLSIFWCTEKQFEQRVVNKYKDRVPELVKAYESQISPRGSSKTSKEEQNL